MGQWLGLRISDQGVPGFCVFVIMDIFAAISFHGVQNWTLLEQCRLYLYGHFRGNLLSRISLPRENKLIYSIYMS